VHKRLGHVEVVAGYRLVGDHEPPDPANVRGAEAPTPARHARSIYDLRSSPYPGTESGPARPYERANNAAFPDVRSALLGERAGEFAA
jgi:hypothetical protein